MSRALLLVLFFPVLSFGESSYLLVETQKQDLLTALNEVEQALGKLKQNSKEKDLLIGKLENHSSEQQKHLENLEIRLQEALKTVDDSESSRLKTESLLTTVSKALKESEQSLVDLIFWTWIKIGVALLTGFGIGLMF